MFLYTKTPLTSCFAKAGNVASEPVASTQISYGIVRPADVRTMWSDGEIEVTASPT